MSTTSTITAVTAALVVALAGCGGGDGSDERARTVTPATTQPAEEVEGGGDATLTEAQLQAALLTVADLPTGYTAAADDAEDEEEQGGTVGEDAECSERFKALDATGEVAAAKADVDFESGLGVVLQQDLSSFEDEDELKDRIDNVVDVLSDCPSFTTEEDEVTTQVTIGQLSFPKLGDDTVALALTAKSEDLDLRLNLVVVRLGRNLMSVSQGGLTADPAALEQATRTGLDKLAAATE